MQKSTRKDLWTEERFIQEFNNNPVLKGRELIVGFTKSTSEVIVRGDVTNHTFIAKRVSYIKNLNIHNSTDRIAFDIHRFNIIFNNNFSYENYKYVPNTGRMYFNCPIHGEVSCIKSNHLKGITGCVKCSTIGAPSLTQKEFTEKLKSTNFTALESYKGYHTKILVESKWGRFRMSPDYIWKAAGFGSIRSAIDKTKYMALKLEDLYPGKFDYSNFKYLGDRFKSKFICKVHGEFKQNPCMMLMGSTCPECGKVNRKQGPMRGYSRSEYIHIVGDSSSKLYFIKVFGKKEVFFKIGITKSTLSKRFSGKVRLPYNFNEVFIFESKDAGLIYDLENKFKRDFKGNNYIPQKEFKGMYECFSKDIDLKKVKSFFNHLNIT